MPTLNFLYLNIEMKFKLNLSANRSVSLSTLSTEPENGHVPELEEMCQNLPKVSQSVEDKEDQESYKSARFDNKSL